MGGTKAEDVEHRIGFAETFLGEDSPINEKAPVLRVPKTRAFPGRALPNAANGGPDFLRERRVAGVGPEIVDRQQPDHREILVRHAQPGRRAARELAVGKLCLSKDAQRAPGDAMVLVEQEVQENVHRAIADVATSLAPRAVGVSFIGGIDQRAHRDRPGPFQILVIAGEPGIVWPKSLSRTNEDVVEGKR